MSFGAQFDSQLDNLVIFLLKPAKNQSVSRSEGFVP